jgi:acetyl-CoA carboxylase biotin carboxyl carrier protein
MPENKKDLSVDSELVLTLASLLERTGLTEIEYAVGDRRIRIAKTVAAATVAMPAPAAAASAAPAQPSPQAAPALADHPGAVKSPMVGTAYLAAQPGAPPFVKIGDSIAEGEVILIIEAMKVMNQIRAPRAGRVAQILVADAEPVEYGQVLMVLE